MKFEIGDIVIFMKTGTIVPEHKHFLFNNKPYRILEFDYNSWIFIQKNEPSVNPYPFKLATPIEIAEWRIKNEI